MESRPAGCNPVATNQSAIGFLHEMDRALHDFLQWQKRLYRALISDAAVNPETLSLTGEVRGAFGKWFLDLPETVRDRDPAIRDIWDLHERMHDAACDLLAAHVAGKPIAPATFDAFVDLSQDFKLAMLKYQRRIISEVCTLDPLTGAGNRYAMDLRLTEEWERSRRSGSPCSLCMLDIDHFKEVNDTYGHAVGDTVLRMISRYLKGDGRSYDDLFRYGGEEFLICMPNTPLDDAEVVFNRLREGLATMTIPLEGGGGISVSASFGVTLLLTDEPVEQSIERADHALLCAKNAGRNRVCVWDISSPAGRAN
ncbi:MAG: diguanylate cyclase [Rhodocyclaceae bacterium]|nr:diguanylate cyclase [Rhodocyclaceae bacterium]